MCLTGIRMKEDKEKGNDTKERLLRAAGEVFAERGFRAATVREICNRANANAAAINYHFRDKEGLYSAVLRHFHHSYAINKYPPDGGVGDDATAEERLEAFVRSFLSRILDEKRPEWFGKLMAREFGDPTAALDQIVESSIRPLYNRLALIVKDLIGEKNNPDMIRLCSMSIIGQCLYYYHARHVISRLHHQNPCSDIERLSEHITRFSIGGIGNLLFEGASCEDSD